MLGLTLCEENNTEELKIVFCPLGCSPLFALKYFLALTGALIALADPLQLFKECPMKMLLSNTEFFILKIQS